MPEPWVSSSPSSRLIHNVVCVRVGSWVVEGRLLDQQMHGDIKKFDACSSGDFQLQSI